MLKIIQIFKSIRLAIFGRKVKNKLYKGEDFELKTDKNTFDEIRKYYLEDRPYDRVHKPV